MSGHVGGSLLFLIIVIMVMASGIAIIAEEAPTGTRSQREARLVLEDRGAVERAYEERRNGSQHLTATVLQSRYFRES